MENNYNWFETSVGM